MAELDKATIRMFAEVLADQFDEISAQLAEKDRDGRGRMFSFVSYGVALALADPGLAQMVCREVVGEPAFEKMRQSADGISRVIREHSEPA